MVYGARPPRRYPSRWRHPETPMLREDVGQLDVAKLFDHFESHVAQDPTFVSRPGKAGIS
jgi:hypothetical protein